MILSRIVQIVWLVIAAVSVVEAYTIFNSTANDKTKGWIFGGVAILAILRYVLLRRTQLRR